VWFGVRGFYPIRGGRSGGESFHGVKIENISRRSPRNCRSLGYATLRSG
jgi:hypothetical protein